MGVFTIVYQVELSADQDADAFEAFLKDRYLPAVHKGPTRVGQITGLTLWRGSTDTHEPRSRFLLHMGFDGMANGQLRIDDEDIQGAFDAFGAPLQRLGAYIESGVWHIADS